MQIKNRFPASSGGSALNHAGNAGVHSCCCLQGEKSTTVSPDSHYSVRAQRWKSSRLLLDYVKDRSSVRRWCMWSLFSWVFSSSLPHTKDVHVGRIVDDCVCTLSCVGLVTGPGRTPPLACRRLDLRPARSGTGSGVRTRSSVRGELSLKASHPGII